MLRNVDINFSDISRMFWNSTFFYVDMLYMLARFDDTWTAELCSFKSFLMRPCINEAIGHLRSGGIWRRKFMWPVPEDEDAKDAIGIRIG